MHVISYASAAQVDGQLSILMTAGQSLGNGVSPGGSAVSLTQPHDNKTLTAVDGTLTGLTEPAFALASGAVETILSGCANLLSELIGGESNARSYPFVGFSAAVPGAAYSVIEKGGSGTAFASSVNVVTHLCTLATGGANVKAILFVHGEADHQLGTADYDDDIADIQSDYDTDLSAVTGQAGVIPLFLCQMSSWTAYDDTTSLIPIAQRAAATAGANVHLVCPKYHLTYVDGVHLVPESYRQLGEHYAVALYDELYGDGWQPLEPVSVSRTGAVVTVTFNVPSGGTLVLDDTTVDDPGDYGFEYADNGDGNSVSIASVALDGTDAVAVTLSDTPTGTGQKIRYAYTGTAGNDAGPATGPRGCLRDDDARYTSRHGYALYNWCVHFEEAIS